MCSPMTCLGTSTSTCESIVYSPSVHLTLSLSLSLCLSPPVCTSLCLCPLLSTSLCISRSHPLCTAFCICAPLSASVHISLLLSSSGCLSLPVCWLVEASPRFLNYSTDDGHLRGLSVEIIDAVCKEAGQACRHIPIPIKYCWNSDESIGTGKPAIDTRDTGVILIYQSFHLNSI